VSRSSSKIWTGAALLILVLLVGIDVFTRSQTLALSPLFALAPMVAAATLSPARTTGFAVAAVVAAMGSALWIVDQDGVQNVVRVIDVALMGAASVVVSSVRVRQAKRVSRLTVLAEVAQRAVLPVVPAHARQTDIAVRYESATEDTVIGGDLYDCYHSRSHTRFLLGDVRGKGIGAVEHAARVIRAFRQAAAIQTDLGKVAADMSNYLHAFFDEEEFVTAVLLDTTDASHPVLVNAGHPPPLLVRSNGSYEFVERDADLPLGLGSSFSTHTFAWEPGDRLLLYTDGVSEARDESGEFLPLEQLAPVIAGSSLQVSLDLLLDRIRQHSVRGNLSDDVAVMLLEHSAENQEYLSTAGEHDWLGLLPSPEPAASAPSRAATVAGSVTPDPSARAAAPAPQAFVRASAPLVPAPRAESRGRAVEPV